MRLLTEWADRVIAVFLLVSGAVAVGGLVMGWWILSCSPGSMAR